MTITGKIARAIVFAQEKHKGQVDDVGWAYTFHTEQVADIVSRVTHDENVICAAYLHDTIEDTDTNYCELADEFGSVVADLVMEVTHEGKKDEVGYYFPRLKTRDGILIKFADRLSNLSRMEAWTIERQEHYLKKSKFWNDSDEKALIKPTKRFSVPTPEEVTDYALSIAYDMDGNRFCDFYEQMGWKLSNGVKMSNWKAAVRTWKGRNTPRQQMSGNSEVKNKELDERARVLRERNREV